MRADLKISGLLFVFACIVLTPTTNYAAAITAELAKKCGAMAAKAFPPREVGNPAAGTITSAGSKPTLQRTSRQIQLALKLYF